MKIKIATILHPEFQKALESLLKKEMSIPQCMQLSEAIKKIEESSENANRVRKALLERYVVLDEEGKPLQEGEHPVYKDPESKSEFLVKVQELLNEECEIVFDNKVVLGPSDRMSPQQFLLLSEFVEYKEK